MVRVCADITACCCFVHMSDIRCCWFCVCVCVCERERERERGREGERTLRRKQMTEKEEKRPTLPPSPLLSGLGHLAVRRTSAGTERKRGGATEEKRKGRKKREGVGERVSEKRYKRGREGKEEEEEHNSTQDGGKREEAAGVQ